MTKNIEIITYEYKAVKVTAKIDYDNGLISLVENQNGEYRNKSWTFAKRSLKYMQGWKNVLEAQKYAIEQAEKLLYEHENKKKVVKENELMQALEISKELEDAKKKYKDYTLEVNI